MALNALSLIRFVAIVVVVSLLVEGILTELHVNAGALAWLGSVVGLVVAFFVEYVIDRRKAAR